MGAAALVAGPVIGGIGISNVDNQPDRVVSVQGTEYVKRELPNDMSKVKMTTDDKGNRVYIWTVRQGMKPTFTYHFYAPVEHVKEQGVAEGTEQVYKVLAVDKSNALSKKVMLTVKAGSIEEVFERLAINDWYPFEINGVEVINGKRLKKDVKEGTGDEANVRRELADAIKDYEWHKQGGSSRGLEYAIDRIKKLQAQLPKSKTGLDIDRSVPGITRATLSDIDPGTMGKKLEKLSSFSDYQAGVADQGRSGRVRPKISPDNYTQRDDMREDTVDEKAVSKQQQKFFGMVHALQKGKPVKGASPKLKQAAADISKGDVKDFAKTRHSGLPSKVKKG